MKSSIDKNTKLRMESKNEFDKGFYKLMNNILYGKTMGNVKNHSDIKLVINNARRKQLAFQPNYHTCKHFSKHLMVIELRKTRAYMNKSICIGQTVLDIRKTLMYRFSYDYLKPKYEDKIKLCYMDTDSCIFYVETDDFYNDISNDIIEWFDTSDYNKDDDRLPTGINENIIGKFKDELKGKLMTEFVALGSKAYAKLDDNDKKPKKVKEINKCIRDKVLMFNQYMDVLLLNKRIRATQQVIIIP